MNRYYLLVALLLSATVSLVPAQTVIAVNTSPARPTHIAHEPVVTFKSATGSQQVDAVMKNEGAVAEKTRRKAYKRIRTVERMTVVVIVSASGQLYVSCFSYVRHQYQNGVYSVFCESAGAFGYGMNGSAALDDTGIAHGDFSDVVPVGSLRNCSVPEERETWLLGGYGFIGGYAYPSSGKVPQDRCGVY